jgi:hypothetical protein
VKNGEALDRSSELFSDHSLFLENISSGSMQITPLTSKVPVTTQSSRANGGMGLDYDNSRIYQTGDKRFDTS